MQEGEGGRSCFLVWYLLRENKLKIFGTSVVPEIGHEKISVIGKSSASCDLFNIWCKNQSIENKGKQHRERTWQTSLWSSWLWVLPHPQVFRGWNVKWNKPFEFFYEAQLLITRIPEEEQIIFVLWDMTVGSLPEHRPAHRTLSGAQSWQVCRCSCSSINQTQTLLPNNFLTGLASLPMAGTVVERGSEESRSLPNFSLFCEVLPCYLYNAMCVSNVECVQWPASNHGVGGKLPVRHSCLKETPHVDSGEACVSSFPFSTLLTTH